MENRDAKLGWILIILIIAIFIILVFLSKHIPALFQNQSLFKPTSFFGLAWFQIFNLVFLSLTLFDIFSSWLQKGKAEETESCSLGTDMFCF